MSPIKQVKCASCGEKLEASTSRKVADLQDEHWNRTGHRRYKSIRGMGQVGLVLPVHPELGDVDDPTVESWTSPPSSEPGPLTEAELVAYLAPYATKKELAAFTKSVATRHDLNELRIQVGQHVKAATESSGDAKLRAEVTDALQKAAARLREVEKVGPRVRSLEDWKRGAVEVLNRAKELEKGIQVFDPRMGDVLEQLERLVDEIARVNGRTHITTGLIAALAHHQGLTIDGARVDVLAEGLAQRWKDGKTPGMSAADIRVAVLNYKPPDKPVEQQPNGAEEHEPEAEALPAMPVMPEECRLACAWLVDGAHRLRCNRYEAASMGAQLFDIDQSLMQAYVTVGLAEGWLIVEKQQGEGSGRPKVVVKGAPHAIARLPQTDPEAHKLVVARAEEEAAKEVPA